jgi:hypothetical protein|tara:strand:- start:345 stop:968 length:624 start_codon:yes stop_codon:yes gene_type:complete
MLNLNDVKDDGRREFELIPDNTVCRVILKLQGGHLELPQFGKGQWFKSSASTKAKWLEIEYTIIGGQYDKQKFWDKIFVDGDKMSERNVPYAQEIGMRTIKGIVDSANDLKPSDMDDSAMAKRNLSGVEDLNGLEFCAKVGIQEGTNGYADKNVLKYPITFESKDFIARGAIAGGSVSAPSQPQNNTQASVSAPSPMQGNNVPDWAK